MAVAGFAEVRDERSIDVWSPSADVAISLVLIGAGAWVARRVVSGGRRFRAFALVAGGEFGIVVAHATLPGVWGRWVWFTGLGVAWLFGVTFLSVLTATRFERDAPPRRAEAAIGCVALALVVLLLLVAGDAALSTLKHLQF